MDGCLGLTSSAGVPAVQVLARGLSDSAAGLQAPPRTVPPKPLREPAPLRERGPSHIRGSSHKITVTQPLALTADALSVCSLRVMERPSSSLAVPGGMERDPGEVSASHLEGCLRAPQMNLYKRDSEARVSTARPGRLLSTGCPELTLCRADPRGVMARCWSRPQTARKCRAWPAGQCSPRDPGCRT